MRSFFYRFLFLLVISIISCNKPGQSFDVTESNLVKDTVTNMVLNVEKDISISGPAAWLNYFENSPHFFMATDGNLVFKDYQSAKAFILNTLVKSIPHIKLRWDHIRVEPFSDNIASIGADFQEELTSNAGKTVFFTGYFTATAHKTNVGWKLINVHWSIKPQSNTVR